MKADEEFNIALVRLGDVIQPPAGEYLRDIPLYHLVYQDVALYCKKIKELLMYLYYIL
ncbi:MAG: hypothetical protein NTW78_12485 [Campylobacterales bacterium]|nr:hypothetical protein [Campylobacterales bacterium]